MARRAHKPTTPTKPLVKKPISIGSVDSAAVIGELRKLHEDAEDPSVDRLPDDGELFTALLYFESHAGALKDEQARRAAALKRVLLWEYLREQADLHQARAVEDARAANAAWSDLVDPLAVGTPSAAYNKAARLRASVLRSASHEAQQVRRTPEAVLEAERQIAARAAAVRRAQEEASRRHELLVPVARRLLEHRAELVEDDEVAYWLDEVAEVLPHCETPVQKLSLSTYVQAAVRELRRAERTTARAVAISEDAQLAYAAAAALFHQ
ncbi:hypothetical protein ABZ471_46725 [Streptomyces sp. NPDC005728]|uniref:hypothetical protein n=1 Tax=Streptomyces sp. NPDC005728 TaxID=3157054 RepID=UPI0033CFA391